MNADQMKVYISTVLKRWFPNKSTLDKVSSTGTKLSYDNKEIVQMVHCTLDEYLALQTAGNLDENMYYNITDEDLNRNIIALNGFSNVLWNGVINTIGNYNLSDNINNYDYIIIEYSNTSGIAAQSNIYKSVSSGIGVSCIYGHASSSDYSRSNINNSILKVLEISGTGALITKVSGIKFGGATNYSTDEQIIGSWIDGKPLYKKTVQFGVLPTSATKNVAHGISNMKNIVKINGVAITTGNKSIPLPYTSTSANFNIALVGDTTNISIASTSNSSIYTGYIDIEYIKTTD